MSKIMLKNVRLAFPVLFTQQAFRGGEPSFSGSFLFDKEHPAFKEMQAGMREVAEAKWGAKGVEVLKAIVAKDNACLHNGDTKSEYEGYAGNFFVSARNKTRPKVFDINVAPLTPADGKPYSGCYVNALVEIWAQDSKDYGRRINASLLGVQFFADGDAFSGGGTASEDDFEDLSSGASAADFGGGSDGEDLF